MFLLIFGALDIITRHFPTLIVTREPLFVGRVANVNQDFGVKLTGGDMVSTRPFMRRENDANDINVAHHRFVFMRRRFECLILAVTPEKGDSKFFYIPIPGSTEIKADSELFIRGPKWSVVWLQDDAPIGQPKPSRELMPDEEASCVSTAPPTKGANIRGNGLFDFFGLAIAQGTSFPKQLSADSLATLLQSDDPFVRRKARRDLGAIGPEAEPTLKRLLESGNYREQIGAVEAINAMKPDARSSLKSDVWRNVEGLKKNADPSLRDSAQRALTNR
jgi:hypothetical protein